jgi:hypothetical protein
MSLNRYEQAVFDYLEAQLDERRHWQMKITESGRRAEPPGVLTRGIILSSAARMCRVGVSST